MIAPLLAFSMAATAPSFDCAAARTQDERAICADSDLAADDALMARLYARTRASAFGTGLSGEPDAQRTWLKQRDCKPTPGFSRLECLRAAYQERNYRLATAIAVRDPALALPVLRKLDPQGAPLIEAVVSVALLSPGTSWTSPEMTALRPRLAQMLSVSAKQLFETGEWSFGRDILADGKITSLDHALASELSFASFIQVSSAYLTEGPVIPRPLPCEAIVRRPGLLAATEAVFGSTFDNFIVTTDCHVTLMPMPALDRLVAAINKDWPVCEGSIRFSAYRGYGWSIDAARLATGRASGRAKRMPVVKGVATGLVTAAIAELSKIYTSHHRATSAHAPALAREKLAAILGAAHNCND